VRDLVAEKMFAGARNAGCPISRASGEKWGFEALLS